MLLIGGLAVWIGISARHQTKEKLARGEVAPIGFGGWLLLLAIGQTIGPLATLNALLESMQAYKVLLTNPVPDAALAAYLEIVMLLSVWLFQIFVVVAMYRRKVYFPTLFLFEIATVIVQQIADRVMVSALLRIPMDKLIDTKIVGEIITGCIWIAYLGNSVRVKNTFVR